MSNLESILRAQNISKYILLRDLTTDRMVMCNNSWKRSYLGMKTLILCLGDLAFCRNCFIRWKMRINKYQHSALRVKWSDLWKSLASQPCHLKYHRNVWGHIVQCFMVIGNKLDTKGIVFIETSLSTDTLLWTSVLENYLPEK